MVEREDDAVAGEQGNLAERADAYQAGSIAFGSLDASARFLDSITKNWLASDKKFPAPNGTSGEASRSTLDQNPPRLPSISLVESSKSLAESPRHLAQSFKNLVETNESSRNLTESSRTLPEKPSSPIEKAAAIQHSVRADVIARPWNSDSQFMTYDLMKDSKVKIGQGPYHVAERLLGKDATETDKRALSNALKDQFKEETGKNPDVQGIQIGKPLITKWNIDQILDRLEDPECKQRITERLRQGFTAEESPHAVPLDKRARPGETRPDRIDDDKQFLKDIADAAIEVGAKKLWRQGKCAQGARMALNELPNWNIEGGTVDKSIEKDPNGWRSGITLARDLAASGLFDVVPLKELGIKNLKDGYILGRLHHPEYVKERPGWGGEDFGDIHIVTKIHKPEDDGDTYRETFVLIPKKK